MKKKQDYSKLSLSKRTISSLGSHSANRAVGGNQQLEDGATITKFWTPNVCRIVSDPAICGGTTRDITGCASC